jgi:hypothetical protein
MCVVYFALADIGLADELVITVKFKDTLDCDLV